MSSTQRGCKIWNPHPQLDEVVNWSGACVNGLAHGPGSLQWLNNGKPFEKDQGEWSEGRQFGRGTQDWYLGRYDGELLNGEPNGRGVMTLQGLRYEGEFLRGKPNGTGTVTSVSGTYNGSWKDGCLIGDKRRIAFGVPSASCR